MDDSNLEIGETREVAPGVLVERRSIFRALAGAAAAFSLPLTSRLAADEIARGTLTFDEFLSEANPIAKKLIADTTLAGQDRYLLTLASLAVRLTDVAVPEMRDSGQGVGPGTFIGFNPGGDPFAVLHWRMQPDTAIRLHAHTYGNVVTLGLEGEAHVENFEMEGDPDFTLKTKFKVRRTREQWLTPGGVNLVNLKRDYVHGITAGAKGARGLDITTRIREKEPTPYLDLARKPLSASEPVYEASWVFDAPKS